MFSIFCNKNKDKVDYMEKRQISISQVKECRHMWSEGICLKCGITRNDEVNKNESALV